MDARPQGITPPGCGQPGTAPLEHGLQEDGGGPEPPSRLWAQAAALLKQARDLPPAQRQRV